jgi:thymidylate synthase (FAD)
MKIDLIGGGFINLEEAMGSDLTVCNSARVSFGKKKEVLDEKDEKLIKYLAEHKHWTPFSQPQLRFHIKMPIFVARQWFKHQIGITRNEMSRRYVSSSPEFFLPSDLRLSADNVKQGSSEKTHPNNENLLSSINSFYKVAESLYENLLNQGVCAEQSRMILPQAMFTEFIETGSLAAYARIYGLRAEKSAQKEIQEYAKALGELTMQQFPISWKYLAK